MSRVLILGANGLLGQAMQHKFSQVHQVTASSAEEHSYLSEHTLPYIQADLTSRADVRNLIAKADPEIIINTAAYTNVDGCEEEREKCWAVNVLAMENVLEASYVKKPTIVHISTDYVFDGEQGRYRETDAPNPRGNYARSKMAAENILNGADFEYIIARTQVLYGTGKEVRPNFVTWLINSLRENKSVQIVTDQTGSPTYVPDVAEAVSRLLEKEVYGLFHVSSPDILSRYDFALQVAEIFELDASLIYETTTDKLQQKSPRPMNSSFILDKLYNNINWQPRSTMQALQHMKTEMER